MPWTAFFKNLTSQCSPGRGKNVGECIPARPEFNTLGVPRYGFVVSGVMICAGAGVGFTACG